MARRLTKGGKASKARSRQASKPKRGVPKVAAHRISRAKQAAVAIENTRLLRELRERADDLSEALRQQTATANLLKVISHSEFDLQAVFDTLIASAVELSGAFNGTICLREGEGYRYLAKAGPGEMHSKFRVDHPLTSGRGSAAGRALVSGNVESIPLENSNANCPPRSPRNWRDES
jgi:hypothetical protein